jgi:3-hydroxyisobutyrate dehydrogenase-like beta-hydroxyacid dehydrogenase
MLARGAEVYAYDVLLEQEGGREMLARRAGGSGVQLLPLEAMVSQVTYVLSTNATHVALPVAGQCAPLLRPGQAYVDLNSTSPQIKRQIHEAVTPSGADFVEGAILDAIGSAGSGAQILLGGPHAARVADALGDLGLNAYAFSDEIGPASTLKMLRSVFSKGMEALLIECLVAARRAGVQDAVWEIVADTMGGASFERQAENWVRTHAGAHERRYHEMIQVEDTVRGLGLEPLMTAATRTLFGRSGTLGLSSAFSDGEASMDAVLAFLAEKLGRTDAHE